MPSKRDQLRKLKEGRKKEPIQEMSSPVDDTLKKLDNNGEPIAEERKDHVNGVDIVKNAGRNGRRGCKRKRGKRSAGKRTGQQASR